MMSFIAKSARVALRTVGYRRYRLSRMTADEKWAVLSSRGNPGGVWVESGTFLGDMTQRIVGVADRVISIEPQRQLAEAARARFESEPRIEIICDTSESALPAVLRNIEKGPVTFWLDGHFSRKDTFRGAVPCPVLIELEAIEAHLERLRPVTILIDDMRFFGRERGWPSVADLEQWAARTALRSEFVGTDILMIG